MRALIGLALLAALAGTPVSAQTPRQLMAMCVPQAEAEAMFAAVYGAGMAVTMTLPPNAHGSVPFIMANGQWQVVAMALSNGEVCVLSSSAVGEPT